MCRYLNIPRFLTQEQIDGLLKRSKELLSEFDPDKHPLTKFKTGNMDHIGNDYFINSGDKIRYFLDEGALDADGNLTREKDKAVNKIGHGERHIIYELHEVNGSFHHYFSPP